MCYKWSHYSARWFASWWSVPFRQGIAVGEIYIVAVQKTTIRMFLSLESAVEPRPRCGFSLE